MVKLVRVVLVYKTQGRHETGMFNLVRVVFMPPKELWEAYSNRTVRPSVRQSVRPSVRQSVRPAFVSGPYLLYSLR